MRKVVAITYVMLDGVMQSPGAPEEDPRNGFTYGGWMVPYFDETLGKLFLERNVTGTFDLLLGRRTYEMLAAHWPYAGDNPVTDRYNKATKFVVTRSLAHFDWVNSERIDGDVTEAVRRLKSADGSELQIIGSSELLANSDRRRTDRRIPHLDLPARAGSGKAPVRERRSAGGALAGRDAKHADRRTDQHLSPRRRRQTGFVSPGKTVRSGTGAAHKASGRRHRSVKQCRIGVPPPG
jgi:dihydrofolate reductase